MRQNVFFTLVCALLTASSWAQSATQEIIASDGGTARSKTMVLDWTLGEPVTESAFLKDQIFTQGFHQPVLEVTDIQTSPEHSISSRSLPQTEITLSPNPVNSILTLDITIPLEWDADMVIMNNAGQVVSANKIPAHSRTTHLDVSEFPQGIYMLRIYGPENSLLRTFKISKIQ